jgi:hypothetical protein
MAMDLSALVERLRRLQDTTASHKAECPQCGLEYRCHDSTNFSDALDALVLELEIDERRQREKASA